MKRSVLILLLITLILSAIHISCSESDSGDLSPEKLAEIRESCMGFECGPSIEEGIPCG